MKKIVSVLLSILLLGSMLPGTVGAAQELIYNIACQDKGTALIGSAWGESPTVKNYDGGSHLWSGTQGDGFEVDFGELKAGKYEVYYWRAMHEHSTDCMAFTLTHNGAVTATAPVNLQEGNSEWVLLGIYEFSGKGEEKLVHMVSPQAGVGISRATAVKLVETTKAVTPDTPAEPSPTKKPTVPEDGLVYNIAQKGNGVNMIGIQWRESPTVLNYDGLPHLWCSGLGNGFEVSFAGIKPGRYQVLYWRASHEHSNANMRFNLWHNGVTTATAPVNQQETPSGWELLGVYDFSGTGEEKLLHMITEDQVVSRATAVKLVETTEPASPDIAPNEMSGQTVSTTDPTDLIDEEPIDGFTYQGNWMFSSALAGPMLRKPGSLWIAETPGASCKYDPKITAKGQVRISIYKLWWPGKNDPKVRYNIVHNGKTDVFYLDTAAGSGHEWVTAGTFDFAGTGDEYVELVRECEEDGINTRAGTIKFEILNTAAGDTGSVWQTVYVTPSEEMTVESVMAPLDQFGDMKEHWANYDVEYMAYRGYVKGKEEGVFAPEDSITRAEFITLLTRALDMAEQKTTAFDDVGQNQWFAGYVGAAEAAGLLKGLPVDDGFLPEQPITREEIALFLFHAIQKEGADVQWLEALENPFETFRDLSAVSPWAKDGLSAMVHAGIIKGLDERTLAPQETATRAQATVMLKRFMQLFVWAGPPKSSQWELTFQDEFSGTELDWDIWESDASFPGHILSSRWPENVEVEDGLCKLVTKKEQRGGAEWTTASIWVKDSVFEQTYGYWEARYRYAPVRGINNAWWMMTKSGNKQTPESFEIDINEGHYQNILNLSFHTGQNEKGAAADHTARKYMPFDLSQDFHTYGLEWTETELIYYFDGQEVERKSHVNAKYPVYPWLSTAVINWAGGIADEADGTSMDVDYVRVYRKK